MVILVIALYLSISFKLSIKYVKGEQELTIRGNPLFKKVDGQFRKIFDIIMKQGHI